MRVLIAGILGGIAMYIWATLAHTVLPLGAVGLHTIPNDGPVIAALQQAVGDKDGLYRFPGGGMEGDAASQKAYAESLKTSAQGLIAYRKPGTAMMTPTQLGFEAGLEIVEALLLALVLSLGAAATFGRRVGVSVGVGLIAAVSTNLSYWNWYGFGIDYSLANGFVELVKYTVAGVVIALVMGWRRKAA